MQRIYHSATEVIAWIGEDNGARDEQAINFIYQLHSRAQKYFETNVFERLGGEFIASSADTSSRLDKETLDWIESVTPLGFIDSVWLDLTALLSRPWFSRIWIVQEVVMGRSVTIQCGRHQLKWMDIAYCALFVSENAPVLMKIAAPQCLKSHDPGRSKLFRQSMPGYHLLSATENIRRIAHLYFRKQSHSFILEIAKPKVDTYLKFAQDKSHQPGHLFGLLSVDSGAFQLFDLAALSSNKASQQTNLSRNLDPPVEDLRFVQQYLPECKSVDELVGWVDDKIPIYTTRGPESTKRISHQSLWTMVKTFRAFSATDPKDKIYALIGLAAEVEHIASLPSISYEMDVFEAFDVLIDIELRGSGKLCFLSEACGLDCPEGFPSWMPLWYLNDDQWTPSEFETLELEPQILFRAAGNTQAVARRSREEKTLNLSGAIVSRIEKIGDVYDRTSNAADVEAVRTKWADMVGAGSAERMAQRLIALVNEGRISEIELFALFKHYLQLAPFERVAYEEFQAVMLASVDKAGVELLQNPPQDKLTPTTGHTLPNGRRVEDRGTPIQNFIMNRPNEVCHGRRLFVCDNGKGHKKLGLAPRAAQVGDSVALFLGANLLYIIRETGTVNESPAYRLVGDAYVHSWMSSELLRSKISIDSITLI